MQFFEGANFPTKSFRPHKLDVIGDALNFGALYAIFGCTGCVLLPAFLHRLDSSPSFATLQHLPAGRDAALACAAAAATAAATYLLMRLSSSLRSGIEQDYEEARTLDFAHLCDSRASRSAGRATSALQQKSTRQNMHCTASCAV